MPKLEQISTASVRPAILRAYYEATFGKSDFPESALPEATFEELYALKRIRFPGVSRRRFAAESRRFRELAATFPDERKPQPLLPGLCSVERQTELDLAKAPIDLATQTIQVSRVKNLTGLAALRKPKELINLRLTLCSGSSAEKLSPPVEVEEVHIVNCSPPLVDTVLRSIRAKRIHLDQQGVAVFDVSVLKAQTALEQLRVFAGLMRGVAALSTLPVEVIYFSNVAVDDKLRCALSEMNRTLRRVFLENEKPFSPAKLPELPNLTRLTVPAYPEYRRGVARICVVSSPDRLRVPATQDARQSAEGGGGGNLSRRGHYQNREGEEDGIRGFGRSDGVDPKK